MKTYPGEHISLVIEIENVVLERVQKINFGIIINYSK